MSENRTCQFKGCRRKLVGKQRRFCCREHAGNTRLEHKGKECPVCGDEFYRREKEDGYSFKKRKTCSLECRRALKRKNTPKTYLARSRRRTLDAMPEALLKHWYPLNPGAYNLSRVLKIDVTTAFDLAHEAGVSFGSKNVAGQLTIRRLIAAEAAYANSRFDYRGPKK